MVDFRERGLSGENTRTFFWDVEKCSPYIVRDAFVKTQLMEWEYGLLVSQPMCLAYVRSWAFYFIPNVPLTLVFHGGYFGLFIFCFY